MRAQVRVNKIGTRDFKVSLKQGNVCSKKNIRIPKDLEETKKVIAEVVKEFKNEEFIISEKEVYKALKEKGDKVPVIIY